MKGTEKLIYLSFSLDHSVNENFCRDHALINQFYAQLSAWSMREIPSATLHPENRAHYHVPPHCRSNSADMFKSGETTVVHSLPNDFS